MNVEELLKAKDITYLPRGKDFVVKCLNPEHPDKNPSMRIDQLTGIFNCFSCEYKGNLFTHFGEKADHLQMRREFLKKKINEKRAESIGLAFPENAMPYVGNWRNIKPETYIKFEAFMHSGKNYINRINFPIRDRTGNIRAFIGRHTAMGVPKYLNSPPGAKMPLFPIVEPIQSSVILVEGVFDMLNLHDKGLTNAICCFGVKNVDEDKLGILSMQGVDHIDIFMDNDDAGQGAADKLKGMCEKVGLTSRNIKYGDKITDAGSLSLTQVEKLKSRLYA